MTGTAINREDILYLSQVCEMAHRLIPSLWINDQRLLKDVKVRTQHLDTLNEIWWLGRWAGLDEKLLEREVSIVPNSAKTIDWRFRLFGTDLSPSINVEVKRLISSLGARAYKKNHYFYAALRADGSINKNDPRLKFKPSSEDEVNVLAVTWFDEISTELETEIQRFLDEDDKIDCVVIWAPGDRRRGGWMRFFPRFRDIPKKRQVISSLLVDPDDEDKARIIAFMFPRTLASIQAEMNAM